MLKGKVYLSTLALTTIGLFDLVTTLILIELGVKEGNPLFRWFLSYGPFHFAIAKVVFLAGPIAMLEYARQHKPRLAEVGTWTSFCLYAMLYVGHIITLH